MSGGWTGDDRKFAQDLSFMTEADWERRRAKELERRGENREARTVPAAHFVGIVAANTDNEKMSDREFREFIRNTLPIVIYDQ